MRTFDYLRAWNRTDLSRNSTDLHLNMTVVTAAALTTLAFTHKQTAKQSVYLRIQERTKSQTKGLEWGWKRRTRLRRDAKNTLASFSCVRLLSYQTDFEKKKRLFCGLTYYKFTLHAPIWILEDRKWLLETVSWHRENCSQIWWVSSYLDGVMKYRLLLTRGSYKVNDHRE